MKRRLFVAISIPPKIKEEVALWQRRHPDFNVRWIKPDNLHLTVVPPWYAEDAELHHIENELRQALNGFKPFSVHFQRIFYGPPRPEVRLIWAEGETPEEFKSLKSSIELALSGNPETGFVKKENRPPKLHLTIARFEPAPMKKLPQLDEAVNWKFTIDEVALMESVLKREGAEYITLRKFEILNSKFKF